LARQHGLSYSRLMDGLRKAGIELDRKQLAVLALQRDQLFSDLVHAAKDALGQQAA
jgi:large subunit ribosomal protein L20